MTYFPTQLLRPRHAVLSGLPDDASLTVALHPFRWNEDCEEETEIRLDNIRLPSLQPQDLIGRSFQFPLNDAAATPTMPPPRQPCLISTDQFILMKCTIRLTLPLWFSKPLQTAVLL